MDTYSCINLVDNYLLKRFIVIGGAFGGKDLRMFLVSVPTAIAAHK